MLADIIREMGFRKAEDFYIALGAAKISPKTVVSKVMGRLKAGEAADEEDPAKVLAASRRNKRPAAHSAAAYGIRVEHDGRSLVYSGDTALCRSLCELAADADLLLAEAAFRDGVDNPPGIHMTGSEAAAVARDARVGRLVLTHIPPWHAKEEAVAEARGVYDGPVLLAHEGATYDL